MNEDEIDTYLPYLSHEEEIFENIAIPVVFCCNGATDRSKILSIMVSYFKPDMEILGIKEYVNIVLG